MIGGELVTGGRPSAMRFQASITSIPDMPADAAKRGECYTHCLTARVIRTLSPVERDELGLPLDGPVLILRSTHGTGSSKFLEERVINLAAVPEAIAADFSAVAPGTWLLRNVPWTEAEHRISAAAADRETAAALRVRSGEACLLLERRTWRGTERITFARLTMPGQDHELVARFRPQTRPWLLM